MEHTVAMLDRAQDAPEGRLTALDLPVSLLVRVNRETLLYAAIIALAALLRFWDLGYRMLHHDESIHAVYSWYLLTGRGYVHNPTYHGPFLYHAEALLYFLFGAADYTTRMAPAIFGTIIVGMPCLLRRQLGRSGALVAALLLAVSPSILYYSRSLRHDVFALAGTFALIVALWRYKDERQPRWLYLAAAGLLLGFANHELTFMSVFMLALFVLPFAGRSLVNSLRERDPAALSPFGEFLVFVGTLAAPQFTAAVLLVRHLVDPASTYPPVGQFDPLLVITLAALLILSTSLGLWWNRRVWLFGALIFYVAFVLLYTAFLSNPNGFFTGTVGGLQYWITQHDVKRGGQPWFYYLVLMPLYEFLPLVFGLGAMAYAALRRHFFGLFLTYWAVLSFILYSWAGEKMPWLVIHITLPFVLLAAMGIGHIIESLDWRSLWTRGAGLLALWYVLLLVVFAALWGRGWPFGAAPTPLQGQQDLSQWLFLTVLAVILLVLVNVARLRLGRGAKRVFALVICAIMLLFTMRAAWTANYYNGDIPVEMLVYTQSTPDVGKVMKEIERVGFRTGAGADLKVAYDDSVSWPFEWYLRDFRSRQFFGSGLPAADLPIVLVGLDDERDSRVKAVLGDNYVGQRYKLRWWFPEDYRDLTSEKFSEFLTDSSARGKLWRHLGAFLTDPSTRDKLWRYFLYRETLNPLGSTDFMMYERRDLVTGMFSVAAGAEAPPQQEPAALPVIQALPIQTFGAPGKGDGQLAEPKGIAVAANGAVYVADSRNNRVQLFDKDGRFVSAFGGAGNGDGQFAEPWGVAVAPNGTVYVADTWNHRIQQFDPNGLFLAQWGKYAVVGDGVSSPGGFFGPRGIAVDGHGNVWVTDTGNHRLQKFDKDGNFLAVFGLRGAGDVQFNEPVGIFVDQAGAIYIADTWNRRVLKFDSNVRLVGRWTVPAWQSKSPTNKPYLAADADGNVYLTDPDNNRLIKLGPTGTPLLTFGKAGSDPGSVRLPTGIAVDRDGNFFVADSQNNRIVKYGPVH